MNMLMYGLEIFIHNDVTPIRILSHLLPLPERRPQGDPVPGPAPPAHQALQLRVVGRTEP